MTWILRMRNFGSIVGVKSIEPWMGMMVIGAVRLPWPWSIYARLNVLDIGLERHITELTISSNKFHFCKHHQIALSLFLRVFIRYWLMRSLARIVRFWNSAITHRRSISRSISMYCNGMMSETCEIDMGKVEIPSLREHGALSKSGSILRFV